MLRLKAKLIGVNVPARDSKASENFYEKMLGIDFARSFADTAHSMHAPLSEDGLWITVSPRNNPAEGMAAMFAVDDLQQALKQVQSSGGKVVHQPVSMPIAASARDHYNKIVDLSPTAASPSLGSFALVQDNDGNYFWLGQLEEHAHRFFNYGKHDRGLSDAKVERHRVTKQVGAGIR